MKYKYFFLIILLTLIFAGTGHAQGKVAAIDSLVIEFWPDYDRASVLVLLTGALPADTKLPATVTLPYPETAQLNAIARIDSSDGKMKDDILSSPATGELTFITPDLRFRLEYYFPYAVNNNQRSFNFTWLADLSVNRFQLRVQQPISASSLVTKPAAIDFSKGDDGLSYYAFPVQAVPAGQSLSVQVDYTMTKAQLTIVSLAPPSPRVQEAGLPTTSNTDKGINWPIVAVVVGGIIIVIVFIWQIATRRAASNQSITHPTKAKIQSHSKFCRNCGNPIGKGDRFCRKCGTALKDEQTLS
jgi:hypothetical protein